MDEPYSVRIVDEEASTYDYVTTLYFDDDGSLYLKTEHLYKEHVQVTWIEHNDLQPFLSSLGLDLDAASPEEEGRSLLKQIKKKRRTKQEFKGWLNKHGIKSRYGSWSERD